MLGVMIAMKRMLAIFLMLMCCVGAVLVPVYAMEPIELAASQENIVTGGTKILANDQYVFLATSTEVYIYDIEDINTPITTLSLNQQSIENVVLTKNEHLIISFQGNNNYPSCFKTYDVSDVADSVVTEGKHVTLDGGHIASGCTDQYFVVSAMGTRTNYTEFYALETIYNETSKPQPAYKIQGLYGRKIWITGNYLFNRIETTGAISIYRLDILMSAQSAEPALVREGLVVCEGHLVHSIQANENHLFISLNERLSTDYASNYKVYIYDLAQVEAEGDLSPVSFFSQGGRVTNLLANGNTLFVSSQDRKRLNILDVSDITNIQQYKNLTPCNTNEYGYNFYLHNNMLYVCDTVSGIHIYKLHKTDLLDIGVYQGETQFRRPTSGNIRARISVENYFDKGDVRGTLIIASYNEKKLVEIKSKDIHIVAGSGVKAIETDDIYIDNLQGYDVKVFFLDGFDTLIPLTDALILESSEVIVPSSFYVDPVYGDDENAGDEAHPFQTIERARDEVRKYNDFMTSDICVYLKEGNYYLANTLTFTEEDNGFNGYKVIYQAAEGATPVVSGGTLITGWQLYDTERNIYKASAQGADDRHLFVNGNRAVRARSAGDVENFVNDGGIEGFTCSNMEFLDYNNLQNVEFVFLKNWYSRRVHPMAIERVSNDTVKLYMSNWASVNGTDISKPQGVYYYENAYELLDEEGEFYIDKGTDTVYYKPLSGEDIYSSTVVAPKLETIVSIAGRSVISPARNIQLSGIIFKDTTWLSPNTNDFIDSQNLYPEIPSAVVSVKNAKDITVENCVIKNSGGDGISATRTVQDTSFIGNNIYDVSGRGIHIGDWNGPEDSNNPFEIASGFRIENNYIHSVGREYYAATGLSLVYVADTVVAHNEIGDIPYSGMHIGWGWSDYEKTSVENLVIECNYIHDTMQLCNDGGSMYFLGANRATADNMITVRRNYMTGAGKGTHASVYCDTGAVNYKFSENVIDHHEDSWSGYYGSAATLLDENNNILASDVFENNYTSTAKFVAYPLQNANHTPPVNTMVYERGNWPSEALDIINNAGLTENYKHMSSSNKQFRLKKNYQIDGVSGVMCANDEYAFIKTSDTEISVYSVSNIDDISKITVADCVGTTGTKLTVQSVSLVEDTLIVHYSNQTESRIVVYSLTSLSAGSLSVHSSKVITTSDVTMLLNDSNLILAYKAGASLQFYDIASLVQGTFDLENTIEIDCGEEIYVDDEYLCILKSNTIEVYSVNAATITRRGTCPVTAAGVKSMVRDGNLLYVSAKLPQGDRNFIYTYDLTSLTPEDTTGAQVTELGNRVAIDSRAVVEEMAKSRQVTEVQNDKYIFKILYDNTAKPDPTILAVYDAANPDILITTYQRPLGYPQLEKNLHSFGSLCLVEDRLVVTCNRTRGYGNPTVALFDVSNITSDTEFSELQLATQGISVQDNGILFSNDQYVFFNDRYLETLNIRVLDDPKSPFKSAGTLSTNSNNMYADNNYLYVHNETDKTIDIYTLSGLPGISLGPVHKVATIPDTPTEVDDVMGATQYNPQGMCVTGENLFVVNHALGLTGVVNIEDPLNPKNEKSLPLYDNNGNASVYAYGNRVYVVEDGTRLLIYEKD